MKWNWGTKLFILTAAFMIMLIIFAVLMIREEINLVEPDYYPKGQTHQELIEKRQNASSLSDQIQVKVENGQLKLVFPDVLGSEEISGKIHLYHIAEESKDAVFEINPDTNNVVVFNVANLQGRYKLKMDWEHNGSAYYTEKQINIP